jgi:hypothetical protein
MHHAYNMKEQNIIPASSPPTQLPLNSDFQDVEVFISNSSLDGFNEGDGDLMDQLTLELNRQRVKTTRIVVRETEVPSERRESQQIISLIRKDVKESFSDIGTLQGLFMEKLCASKSSIKILYIGSRFDVIDQKLKQPIVSGSGSLFTKEFIQALKKGGIKIVVCCLEYKFFKRSWKELPKAFEMFRQQLFLADKIQFLNQKDKDDFEETLNNLAKNPILYPDKLFLQKENEVNLQSKIVAQSPNINDDDESKNKSNQTVEATDALSTQSAKQISLITELPAILDNGRGMSLKNEIDELGGNNRLLDQKRKGVFISGIYTVNPLSPEYIASYLNEEDEKSENTGSNITEGEIINKLAKRKPNILCFGLIRKHKGIDEAIELGKMLRDKKREEEIFITGKLMWSSFVYFHDILKKMNSGKKVTKFLLESLHRYLTLNNHKVAINASYNDTLQKLSGTNCINVDLSELDGELIEAIFANNKDQYNAFCQDVYQKWCSRDENNKIPVFRLYLNQIEKDIHSLAMKCKYAIKLDHKGMANNASTIVSCLGFYLPTFTSYGMLTGDEFKPDNKYGLTVILGNITNPYSIFDTGEILPNKVPIKTIYDIIISENIETYKKRLQSLLSLYNDKVFSLESATNSLLQQIFWPLAKKIKEYNVSMTNNLSADENTDSGTSQVKLK